MHTSSEMVQYLNYITGQKRIDQSLKDLVYLPFLNKPAYSRNQPKSIPDQILKQTATHNLNDLKDVDLAIVEISTLRSYRLGDLFLQGNCINNYLMEKAGLHIYEDQQLRDMFETQPTDRNIILTSNPILNDLLQNCIAEYIDEKVIESDLLKIKELFGNILILNHFTSTEMPQPVLESRNRLQSIIVSVAKKIGIHWFDVSTCIKELPKAEQLNKRDDFNHYSETAKNHIAHQIGRFVTKKDKGRFIHW
jgi:hypothetical protein